MTGQTSQTGAMVVSLPSPAPLASVPSLVAPGRTNETMLYTSPSTAAAGSALQGSRPRYGPIPNATQMMAYTSPNVHRLAFASQNSTSGSY